MAINGLKGVFGFHRQIGANNDLDNPNLTAEGPYNAGVGDNPMPSTIQTLTIAGASSGNFRLRVRGFTTANIAHNANAAAIQAALEALDTVESGDIVVSGAGPFTFNLSGGQYAGQPVGVELLNNDTLNAGATIALAVTSYGGAWYWLPATSVNFQQQQIVQAIPPEVGGSLFSRGSYKGGVHGEGQVMFIPRGGLGLAEMLLALTGRRIVETTVTDNFGQVVDGEWLLEQASGTASGGNFTLTFEGQVTGNIAHNASAATIQAALEALSNVDVGDVIVTGGALPAVDVTVKVTGKYSGKVVTFTIDDAGLSGTTPDYTLTEDVAALPFANKLIGNGSNGVESGCYRYRFIPGAGVDDELDWYTIIRNVGGIYIEQFADARLGNFAFDIANTNILNIDSSWVSRHCAFLAPGAGIASVGAQVASNGDPFQAVNFDIRLDSNVGGAPGAVEERDDLKPTRLNIGFGNQLSTNEHVVGSHYLQGVTNMTRSANVTYSVYLNNADLVARAYAHGAQIDVTDAAWDPRVWKGALFTEVTGAIIPAAVSERYKLTVNIPEMDYMAAPVSLAGGNLIEYQLTTNVVLSQDPDVFPFYIDYVTDEDII